MATFRDVAGLSQCRQPNSNSRRLSTMPLHCHCLLKMTVDRIYSVLDSPIGGFFLLNAFFVEIKIKIIQL